MRIQTRAAATRAAALAFTVTAAGLALPASTAQAATAAVTCATNVWKASYYANTTFSGTAKKTVCDKAISENYGTGDPAGVTLPKDNFGVRWTVTRNFGSGGPFSFTASAQDGIRVYLDGTRKINIWKDYTSTQKKTVNVTVPKGKHTLRVDFAAFKGKANVTFAYAPRTSAAVDKSAPLAPSITTATYNSGAREAQVWWAANVEMDLAGYRVYRRSASTSAWTRVSGSGPMTGTYFKEEPPATGETFYYEVRAADKAGNESAGSADKPITTIDKTGPAAPTGLSAHGDLHGVVLSWDAMADAVGYEVYERSAATGEYELLKDLTGTTYTNGTGGYSTTLRSFKVLAYDAAGNRSEFSAAVSSDSIDRVAPAAPRTLSTAVSVGSVRLYWETAGSADDELANNAFFTVYRSSGDTLGVGAQAVKCADYGQSGSWDGTLHFQCDDNSVDLGVRYTYAVTLTDGSGNESQRSEPVTVTSGDRTAPVPLTGLTATPRADGMLLSWDAPADVDVARYYAKRGIRKDDGTVSWTGDGNCSDDSDEALALLCIGLPDGESYVYTVIAEDTWGNRLSLTDPSVPTVTATELDVLPSVPFEREGPLFASWGWTGSENAPVLTWYCQDAAGCPGITGYRLSRWNPETQAYEPLSSEPLPVTTTQYTDATAPLGRTSFYRVTGLFADGTETAPADFWQIRPDLA